MASTATDRNKFRKQGTGDNEDTWGTELNEDVIDRIDTALDGLESVNCAGSSNITLTTTDYEENQYRNRMLNLTGDVTADISVVAPQLEKWWFVLDNTNTSNTVTFTASGGNGVELRNGEVNMLYCDGTDVVSFEVATHEYVTAAVSNLADRDWETHCI